MHLPCPGNRDQVAAKPHKLDPPVGRTGPDLSDLSVFSFPPLAFPPILASAPNRLFFHLPHPFILISHQAALAPRCSTALLLKMPDSCQVGIATTLACAPMHMNNHDHIPMDDWATCCCMPLLYVKSDRGLESGNATGKDIKLSAPEMGGCSAGRIGGDQAS